MTRKICLTLWYVLCIIVGVMIGHAIVKAEEPKPTSTIVPLPTICMTEAMFEDGEKENLRFPLWHGINDSFLYTLWEVVETGDWFISVKETNTPMVCILGFGNRHEFAVDEAAND